MVKAACHIKQELESKEILRQAFNYNKVNHIIQIF